MLTKEKVAILQTDMLKSVLEILIKFRQEEIALSAYTKKCFIK